MMKYIALAFLVLFYFASFDECKSQYVFKVRVNAEHPPFLVKDLKDGVMVKHFRASPFAHSFANQNWSALNASGSGTFSEPFLIYLKSYVQHRPLYIIDLRAESHGHYDGCPISWYGYRNGSNQRKPLDEIEESELIELEKLADAKMFQVYSIDKKHGGMIETLQSKDVFAHKVESEQQLVERHGINYFRIPVTDRYSPDDAQIDIFIAFVSQLPDNAWLHFHCRGGKGRSTTFMVLYDIIKNGDKISFQEIVNRNSVIGPKYILGLPSPSSWKYPIHLKRNKMLKRFYDFRNDPKGFGHMTWSMWVRGRGSV